MTEGNNYDVESFTMSNDLFRGGGTLKEGVLEGKTEFLYDGGRVGKGLRNGIGKIGAATGLEKLRGAARTAGLYAAVMASALGIGCGGSRPGIDQDPGRTPPTVGGTYAHMPLQQIDSTPDIAYGLEKLTTWASSATPINNGHGVLVDPYTGNFPLQFRIPNPNNPGNAAVIAMIDSARNDGQPENRITFEGEVEDDDGNLDTRNDQRLVITGVSFPNQEDPFFRPPFYDPRQGLIEINQGNGGP